MAVVLEEGFLCRLQEARSLLPSLHNSSRRPGRCEAGQEQQGSKREAQRRHSSLHLPVGTWRPLSKHFEEPLVRARVANRVVLRVRLRREALSIKLNRTSPPSQHTHQGRHLFEKSSVRQRRVLLRGKLRIEAFELVSGQASTRMHKEGLCVNEHVVDKERRKLARVEQV